MQRTPRNSFVGFGEFHFAHLCFDFARRKFFLIESCADFDVFWLHGYATEFDGNEGIGRKFVRPT